MVSIMSGNKSVRNEIEKTIFLETQLRNGFASLTR
jgi:hypothetical protein